MAIGLSVKNIFNIQLSVNCTFFRVVLMLGLSHPVVLGRNRSRVIEREALAPSFKYIHPRLPINPCLIRVIFSIGKDGTWYDGPTASALKQEAELFVFV